MSSTQLTDINQLNMDNIVFSKPEIGNVAGQKISFKRIRVASRYPDGTVGDLIIATPPNLHSFGLQETRDMASNVINGYSLPLCLWNRNGPSDEEKKFTDQFSAIVDHCKKYLLDHREEIEKYDLDASDLKKFNPLFWKMEKGKIVEGRGPTLYAKAIFNKKKDKIDTIFVNEATNEEVDPFDLLNKVCSVTAALKIESIFIGNKISLQVKLFEVVYKIRDQSVRGLLRPNALKREDVPKTSEKAPLSGPSLHTEMDDEDDDDGSIVLEEDVAAVTATLPVTNVPVQIQAPSNFELSDDEDDDEGEEGDDTPSTPVSQPPAPVAPVAPEPKKRATTARATKTKK